MSIFGVAIDDSPPNSLVMKMFDDLGNNFAPCRSGSDGMIDKLAELGIQVEAESQASGPETELQKLRRLVAQADVASDTASATELREKIALARSFTKIDEDERQQLVAKVADVAGGGKLEDYKYG